MRLLESLTRLLQDPPPEFIFELSPAGIALGHTGKRVEIAYRPLDPDVLVISPVRDNVVRPDVLAAQVRELVPGNGSRKRRRAALILPDYSVRVLVLDFDAFPSDPKEQVSLIRFRLRKSLPFDVDTAASSYYVQQPAGRQGADVVVAVAPLEIVARYEAPFRSLGFHVGWVTTSVLAALELVPETGIRLLAKRSGAVLSLAVAQGGTVRLLRTIELASAEAAEALSHLYPTVAFVEDQMGARPERLHVCGFPPALSAQLEPELGIPVEPLRSRFGSPGESNAGLLGYLESLEAA
jgi:type IV pilus assembly protein PilM